MIPETQRRENVLIEQMRSKNRIITTIITTVGVIISAVIAAGAGFLLGRNDANPEKYVPVAFYEELQTSQAILQDKFDALSASASVNRQESDDAQSRYKELERKYDMLLTENQSLRETSGAPANHSSNPILFIGIQDPDDTEVAYSEEFPYSSGGTPFALSKLKVSSSKNYTQISDSDIEDTVGNRYRSSNLFTIHGTSGDDYAHADYFLGGNYHWLTGVIAVSDQSSDNGLLGSLEFLVDEEVVYVIDDLSRTTSPIKLNFVLPAGQWMKVRYHNTNNQAIWLYQYVILSDITLYAYQ